MTWWRIVLEIGLLTAAWIFRHKWQHTVEEKKELDRRMRSGKKGTYLAFTDILFSQLPNDGGELAESMRKWASSLIMHASDEVIDTFITVQQESEPLDEKQMNTDTEDVTEQQKKMVTLLGEILLKMRKDTYGETELTENNLIRLFVTDAEKVLD